MNDKKSRPPLEASWQAYLQEEFEQPYMKALEDFLRREKGVRKQIFPAVDDMFSALDHTPLPRVKIVILAQDPYHGEGQADGLCFSVRPGIPVPPSLQNIYKELHHELGLPIPLHGDLTHWADQGVLLLNSVLSVESGVAGSHRGQGWEIFTDRIVTLVSEHRQGVVFLLWGSYAQKKGAIIDQNKHLVLTAPHPSPLSAYRGFFGCGHFQAANDYLAGRDQDAIDWSLPADA
ncbi:MAG: uracil-DNA glycosylase [Alcanivorax sp.]